jgi:hypothetical protein
MAELPRNAGYLIAAYAIAAVIYLGYYLRLRARARRAAAKEHSGT